MASSSVSQEDHDVEHEFAIASRRAKVRSARANRSVNNYPMRGEECEKDVDESHIPKLEQTSVVLVEQNDASPKPICRGVNKDKRSIPRGAHAGKSNKGARDRRKLREKRRSTGVMHLPSTESTGGSTGEDENNENSLPPSISKVSNLNCETEEKVTPTAVKGKSDSDLDADDEANNSDVKGVTEDKDQLMKTENDRMAKLLEVKERRIAALEIQVSQLTRQISEMREENSKLHRALNPQPSARILHITTSFRTIYNLRTEPIIKLICRSLSTIYEYSYNFFPPCF